MNRANIFNIADVLAKLSHEIDNKTDLKELSVTLRQLASNLCIELGSDSKPISYLLTKTVLENVTKAILKAGGYDEADVNKPVVIDQMTASVIREILKNLVNS